jgi:hypothetical protein
MKYAIELSIVLWLVGCSDVVTTHYPTVVEARRDGLFERGWLPDVLPPSVRDIEVSNNLDINTSVGEFWFDTSEYEKLTAKLTPQRKQTKTDNEPNYEHYLYLEEEFQWNFSCSKAKGYCRYDMRLSQSQSES